MRDGKPILVDEWDIKDVMSVADCMEVDITEEQAIQVLHIVAEAFDVNEGIKVIDFEDAINDVKEK